MRIKENKIAKFFYNFPGASSTYHFLWAWSGAMFHWRQDHGLAVIGVTGTKGKTTTLELLNAILEEAGHRTALLSSLRVKIGEKSVKNRTGNSMPGRGAVQKFLHDAARTGCKYALVEVTSQGVVLHRHRFVHWDVGVLTNLAPEHIEAHGSFENYRAAKLSFLEYVCARGGQVFLNRDDQHFPFFAAALARHAPVRTSKEDETIKDAVPRILAARKAEGAGAPGFILSDFNQENIAIAAAVAKRFGVEDAAIERAILNFRGVPGRMEFISGGGYTAVADYAHTPDSLEAAYRAAKPRPSPEHPSPRLICVLGAAGGGRDTWKRPAMGAVAAKYCDDIILTDEDPYDEDPARIVGAIREGVLGAGFPEARLRETLDRREAIRMAIGLARPEGGDVVIGTGKGSEEWIHVAHGGKLPWHEREEFEKAIAAARRHMLQKNQ